MTQHYSDPEGRQISVSDTPAKGSAHVHKYVAQVAHAAANELYDELMSNNLIYGAWRKRFPDKTSKALRATFVAMNWGKCVPLARATLARLLATSTDEVLKETIYEALCLDATLKRGRGH